MASTTKRSPFAIGFAFAATIAVMYTVCAMAWMIWQEPALDFLNALFHGLDFRRLQIPQNRFSFATFFYALFVLSTWGFVTGTLFGTIVNRFQGRLL
jgi:hypothetical protein